MEVNVRLLDLETSRGSKQHKPELYVDWQEKLWQTQQSEGLMNVFKVNKMTSGIKK
jgi:hypothetical protein